MCRDSRRVGRDAAEGPAIVGGSAGDGTRQRRGVDPLIILVGQRLVYHARGSAEADQHPRIVTARIDACGPVGADLLSARCRRIVDVPGRLLLELVDDLDHARGADAGVDRVGDKRRSGRVVDSDRAGAAIDDDVALRRAARGRADDPAVQVDIAAGALHHAVQHDLVGQHVVPRADRARRRRSPMFSTGSDSR